MIWHKNKIGQLLHWGLGDSMSWESTDLPEEQADGPNQWQEGCRSSVGAESGPGGAGNRGWQFQSDVHGCGHLFLMLDSEEYDLDLNINIYVVWI